MKKSRAKKHIKRAPARRMKQLPMFASPVGEMTKATAPLMVRFSPEQYAYVRHAAALRGQNAAAFIRHATLDVLESTLVKMKPAELAAWKRDAERAAAARKGVES